MADEKEELEPKDGEGAEGEGKQQEPEQEGKQPAEGEGKDGDGIKDKHGQPGINKERHEKEMAAKDAEIAKLQEQLAEAAKTEEGRKELQKQIDEMKASQADERVTHKLEMAGCKNTKAAKALLDDYDGDISKLKEACPYLFEDEKQKGKTGGKHIGSADKSIEDKIDSVFDN
ncbi:MAG: hypothetical protein Q3X42_00480 [Eggerthellaceae bacterium]|nr:hypothetical protein [Eggerthellaceae bacterium]